MRIGIDSHLAEKAGTGNCTYTRNLILHLSRLDRVNHYVLFVTDRNHPFYNEVKDFSNVEIVPICGSPSWFRVFFSLCAASHRLNLDVLHVQYFAPLGHRGRLVNTIHDISWFRFPQFFSRFERFLFKFLMTSSARRSDRIFTVSGLSKEDLVSLIHLPENKIKVIYNGISKRFISDTREPEETRKICSRYGLTGNFLLYVGRIDPRKNLSCLVQAYAFLRSKHSVSHQLAIAGTVHVQPEDLQQVVKNCEFREDIRFCGYVADEDLPALYSGADVFVYTSEYEGFGLPPLEAMASGTPVVASDISIFHEILDDAAVLVNPLDIEAIAEGIYRILSDSTLRKNLVETGKVRAGKFNWDSTAQQTLQNYEEVIKDPS